MPSECRLDGHDEKPRLDDCPDCRAVYFKEMAMMKAQYRAHSALTHCPACLLEAVGQPKASMCMACSPNLHVACETHRG